MSTGDAETIVTVVLKERPRRVRARSVRGVEFILLVDTACLRDPVVML